MQVVQAFLPILQDAAMGALAAASIDYVAFRKWQTWSEAKEYQWGIASWRWFQGAVVAVIGSTSWTGLTVTAAKALGGS